jgi:hypothetical protein
MLERHQLVEREGRQALLKVSGSLVKAHEAPQKVIAVPRALGSSSLPRQRPSIVIYVPTHGATAARSCPEIGGGS